MPGAPSDEAKEPAIAHIPKPTAPTPANSFNPLAIMACAPKNIGGGCMIDYRQLSDARPQDTRMLTPPPVFVCANQGDIRSCRFQHTIC
jgi:hypothetical protein